MAIIVEGDDPIIAVADLTPFAQIDQVKAEAMIADALALATRVAPCITEDTFEQRGAVKAILRGAILRWHEAGSGGVVQQSAGPFAQSTQTTRKGMFWPSEIEELQAICRDHRGEESSGAFTVDTLGAGSIHAPWCAINFGATYCSCGADIAGEPIYETP